MASPNVLMEFSGRSIFRRCIPCPDTPPQCACAVDETCAETSRSCNQCATTTCIKTTAASSPTPTPSVGSGSNAGAIAGGVIGGLAFIAILTFLIWWFVIRKRRQAEAAAIAQQEKSEFRQARQSRRSIGSIASTVLTRASNVIQIAYIPGVTNRSPPDTPGTLVPPVPPLPAGHLSAASAYGQDQHFFMPGDLRDSRYSDMTADRRSIATSLARSSVATTIYRNNAIVSPIPAQQAVRGKVAVVSVKSGTSTPTDALSIQNDAPAVPAITQAQLHKAGVPPTNSSIVARTVMARPVNVKKSPQTKVPTVSEEEGSDPSSHHSSRTESLASHSRAHRFDNNNSTFDDSSDEDEETPSQSQQKSGISSGAGQNSALASQLARPVVIRATSSADQGPFADQPSTQISSTSDSSHAPNTAVSSARVSMHGKSNSIHRHRTSVGSTRLLEEAMSQSENIQRSQSPFSDAHEVK